MEFVSLARDGRVAVATLSRGKANAIVPAVIDELTAVLDEVRADAGVGALVFSSANPKMFSAGFDLPEVFAYDADRVRELFGRFMAIYEGLRVFPKPTVAAVTGHAIAGGALLAIACDFRIMPEGTGSFAINEVNFGVVLPDTTTDWLVDALGPAARRILLAGQAVTPEQALAAGIAHELVPAADVVPRAIALAHELAQKPPLGYAGWKRSIARAYGGPLTREADAEAVAQVVAWWTSDESREARAQLLASVKGR